MKRFLLLLCFCAAARATITETNFANVLNASGCNSSSGSTCTLTTTVTGGRAGIAVVFLGGSSSDTVTGFTDASWKHGCGPEFGGVTNGFDIWYSLSVTGASSLVANLSASGSARGMIYLEASGTLGAFALDACTVGTSSQGSGFFTYTAQAITGLSATDLVMQMTEQTGGLNITSINSSYTCTSSGSSCTANSRNAAWIISASGSAPTWTTSTAPASNTTNEIGAAALKEVSTTTALHLLQLLGVGQ
jgi:hypothetical protein